MEHKVKRTLKTYGNFPLILILSLSILILSVCDGFAAAEKVRNVSLRLHILANSDAEDDQAVKLTVRDEVLKFTENIFLESTDALEAAESVENNKNEITDFINSVLEKNGFDYKASVLITDEYFDTRQYENVKLPAGVYKACKIILGDGGGQNRWCVMFPPLCLPAATKKGTDTDSIFAVFGDNGSEFIKEKSGYKIKFRIVEIAEEIINRIRE